ncbi:MAG TPA: ABC transporter ATP-binding protein [Candidatus Paceibacterota bacterium]|jgi:putative ABC transport system ATP-binding protein|nr:ABC transporter ATP-binding protein [Candidatus Paceibacterota bacterium]
MIYAKNIIKTFKNGSMETHVLKGIDLTINSGEFVAIMGKSGAGKSTLLYQLGLLDDPTSGTIRIENTLTTDLSIEERTTFRLNELGYIFQDYALLPELTALENVMVPLLMQGKAQDEAKKIATASLERIGLGHRKDNLPSQLSGGEQQRVSIARAVAHNPKILFADEPTANLDSESGDAVIEIFRTLHAQGQTIVMVTHEKEYTTYCDRIIHLADGQIVQ